MTLKEIDFQDLMEKVRDKGMSQPELLISVRQFRLLHKIRTIDTEFNPITSIEIEMKAIELGLE